MASDWDTYPISDFVTLSQGLAINAKSKYLLEETGLPLLRITDLINGTQVHFVNEEKAPPKCIATDHELIYTRTGQVGLVYRNKVGVVHNNCFKVIPSPELDKDFLYWFLFQESTKAHVNAVASGSVQKDLNHAAFLTLSIPKPELSEQKAIASILDSLDDKIELNRQMNETLEAMAQALFKSWFVDFDPVIDNALAAGNAIPDEFIERAEQRKGIEKKDNSDIQALFPDEFKFTEEMGWIPKGWESVKLDKLLEVKYGKDHKKLDEGTIPVYGSGGLMRHVNKSLYIGESILIPRKGTLSNLMFVDEEFWTVDTMFFSIPKFSNIAKYIFHHLKLLDLTSMNVGSAVPSMTTKVLNDLDILYPCENTLKEFNRLVTDFYNRSSSLNSQNETLAKLRDTLLPKLMSGELRIADAAALVDEAI